MVKTKHKPAATEGSKSNDSQSSHISPNAAVNSDLPEENSWVIVKKQKVNILIPRHPSFEQNLDHSQCQLVVGIPTTSTSVPSAPPQLSPQKSHEISLAEINDNATTLSPKSDSQSAQKIHTPEDKAASNPGLRKNNFENQTGVVRPLCHTTKSLPKFNEKVHKPTRAFCEKRVNSPGCTTILNKTMRASNVKVKIARAGGLHRWLSSLGLQQFEALFHGKNISKFLVANLSMNKLKDMGYHAVGPRRKLIHAIECPC